MDTINHLMAFVGFAAMVGVCGATLTAGSAIVCRWMNWSPINISVKVYYKEPEE